MFDTLSGARQQRGEPGIDSLDEKPTRTDNDLQGAAGTPEAPVAMLFCSDLMFAVRLQNMARKTGYRVAAARPGNEIRDAAVLLVDIADRGDWETIIRHAANGGIPVIAFGPHMDTAARRRAKAAGAARVLANSNLERDLPGLLVEIRNSLDTRHDRDLSTED